MGFLIDKKNRKGVDFFKTSMARNKAVTYVGWRVTERCNLRCPFCFSVHSKTVEELPLEKMEEGLKVLKLARVRAIGIMGGEPLIYPQIREAIEMVKELGFEVILSTNGFLLKKFLPFLKKRIDWLSLSLDADKVWLNDLYRSGGHFEKATSFIREYHPEEIPFRLKINTVVHNENLGHLEGIGRLLKGKKAVWKLLHFTPRALGRKNRDKFWISLEQFRKSVEELRRKFPKQKVVSREYNHDGDLDTFLIRPDGDILVTYKEVPEEHLKKDYREGYLRIGNLFERSILGKINNLEQVIPDFYQENWTEFSQSYL